MQVHYLMHNTNFLNYYKITKILEFKYNRDLYQLMYYIIDATKQISKLHL